MLTSVEISGKIGVFGVGLGSAFDGPLWVDNSSHKFFDFLLGSTLKLRLNLGLPGCVGIVNELGSFFQTDWLFSLEKLNYVFSCAQTKVLAGLLRLFEVDKAVISIESGNSGFKGWEHFIQASKTVDITLLSVFNCLLANSADEVRFSEKLVNVGGVSDGKNCSGEN